MNKPLKSPQEQDRARLEGPPMPRRDFLGLAALWSAASALGLSLIGLLRLPKAAVLPSPSKKFRPKFPNAMPAGQPFVPDGRNVACVKDANNGIYAISLVCTHLGCIVKPAADGFRCPCHGSVFDKNGAVVGGPAPKGLPWYHVELDEEGTLLVDEGRTVPPGTVVVLGGRTSPGDKT